MTRAPGWHLCLFDGVRDHLSGEQAAVPGLGSCAKLSP